jgi:hypothetical protein
MANLSGVKVGDPVVLDHPERGVSIGTVVTKTRCFVTTSRGYVLRIDTGREKSTLRGIPVVGRPPTNEEAIRLREKRRFKEELRQKREAVMNAVANTAEYDVAFWEALHTALPAHKEKTDANA